MKIKKGGKQEDISAQKLTVFSYFLHKFLKLEFFIYFNNNDNYNNNNNNNYNNNNNNNDSNDNYNNNNR